MPEKMEMDSSLPFTREQFQAAYALNLCTVSVSQIIAYNDPEILEQEYETILNNLNLEYMPKDDALLEILKRLLETITFFRIQESEKQYIEKEYQQKMKNAIWTAVPNLALLVAGGNPVSMGISLASQIGIGYMNYRKNRSQYSLEKEGQLFKLQRSALEQFEGLQQQLFETSWRLADKYQFPDAFRLTERQIRQYNAILMDKNEVRRFERLYSVREQFAAYPPFWYYLGSTANSIARNPDLEITEDMRRQFLSQAGKYFAYYEGANQYQLLREDEISAACFLEYADLLDAEKDREKILSLTDKARSCAGNAWDVHQLCAISYLKADEKKQAARELRILVNEDYNAVINAQLLSGIYVEQAVACRDREAALSYGMLSTRIQADYLFPMPASAEISPRELNEQFVSRQRSILEKMYMLVFFRFMEKYDVMINRIIPLPQDENDTPENGTDDNLIYLDTAEARQQRMKRIRLALSNKNTRMLYVQQVQEIPYSYRLIEILNQLFTAVCRLECAEDEQTQRKLQALIMEAIHDQREKIAKIEESLENFDEEAYCLVEEVTVRTLTGGFTDALKEEARKNIHTKKEMQDFALSEASLIRFCTREGIEMPEYLYVHRSEAPRHAARETWFTPDLFGSEAVQQNERVQKNAEMIRLIRESADRIVLNQEQVEFYTQEDPRMSRYFYSKALQKYPGIRAKTLAVLDDRSRSDRDLVFATDGIMAVIRGHVRNPVSYKKIEWTGNTRKKELQIGVKYDNDSLDMDMLFSLIQKLCPLAAEEQDGSWQ